MLLGHRCSRSARVTAAALGNLGDGTWHGFDENGVRGLICGGQYHFQVRFLGFAAGDFGTADLEACFAEQAADDSRRKPRMPFAIASGHLMLLVLVQTQQHQAPTRTQYPRALRERARRALGIGQRVEDQHGIERSVRKWQLMHIRDLGRDVLELTEALFRRLNHTRIGINAGERPAVRRERRRCRTITRAHIQHVPQLEEGRDTDAQ